MAPIYDVSEFEYMFWTHKIIRMVLVLRGVLKKLTETKHCVDLNKACNVSLIFTKSLKLSRGTRIMRNFRRTDDKIPNSMIDLFIETPTY